MRRPALQNKQAGVLRMAFRARKAFGAFEKRAPEQDLNPDLCDASEVLYLLSYIRPTACRLLRGSIIHLEIISFH